MLIKDIETLSQIVNKTEGLDFENIKSSIEDAELYFIIPIIGQDYYDELNDEYVKISPALSEEDQKALKKIQKALAYFAMVLWMPEGAIKVSGTGLQVVSTEELKTAGERKVDKLEFKYLDSGYRAIDSLLEFLEKNSSDYSTWKESEAYTVFKESFINNAKTFNKNYSIGNSRRTFLRMKAMMKKCEDFYIQSNLGVDFFTEIKTQIKEDNISEDNKIILDFIALNYLNLQPQLKIGRIKNVNFN